MIVKELLEPKSIVVVGGSNELAKPGGRVLKHVKEGGFDGDLYVINPKESEVQGIKCYKGPTDMPNVDLAIIAIAAKYTNDTVRYLAENKATKAFIVLSAGFGEVGGKGAELENELVEIIDKAGGSLIGPNCVGVLTPKYKGAFTGPIPKLDPKGVDFVSGSGATAVFILESAVPMGISFASLFSVGNSAQIGVEDVLEYWDETFDPEKSSRVKMIYIEQVEKPKKFLENASSLINKGCKICAIKAGATEAGSRAVSSHTGALAGSDEAVDALFRKAGIIRCKSKQELVYTAAVFQQEQLRGENIAIITHAGGPGVMLTDILAKNAMKVPHIKGEAAEELLEQLFHGSSVANPIDFLATGTAEQLETILDYVDNKFDNIDGSVVIFGTPGLFDVTHVYETLHEKMKTCNKPIYPVLPSAVQAKRAIDRFVSLGRQYFHDEVVLGETLSKVYHAPKPAVVGETSQVDKEKIRGVIDGAENGYLPPEDVQSLLDAAGVPRASEATATDETEAIEKAKSLGRPIVMKVVGPVHKSDVGGVKLNLSDDKEVAEAFNNMKGIEGFEGVLMQPMAKGTEIFIGAKKEPKFGHLVLCGLGGIFIEVLKDVVSGVSPIGDAEAKDMIKSLNAYDLIKGVRGQEGVSEDKFAEALVKVSTLLEAAPEIAEMDLNPLMGDKDGVVAVDARIRIEK